LYPCMKPFRFGTKYKDEVASVTTNDVIAFLNKYDLPVTDAVRTRTVKQTMDTILKLQGIQVWNHRILKAEPFQDTESFTSKKAGLDAMQLGMLYSELKNIKERVHTFIDQQKGISIGTGKGASIGSKHHQHQIRKDTNNAKVKANHSDLFSKGGEPGAVQAQHSDLVTERPAPPSRIDSLLATVGADDEEIVTQNRSAGFTSTTAKGQMAPIAKKMMSSGTLLKDIERIAD